MSLHPPDGASSPLVLSPVAPEHGRNASSRLGTPSNPSRTPSGREECARSVEGRHPIVHPTPIAEPPDERAVASCRHAGRDRCERPCGPFAPRPSSLGQRRLGLQRPTIGFGWSGNKVGWILKVRGPQRVGIVQKARAQTHSTQCGDMRLAVVAARPPFGSNKLEPHARFDC